MLEPVAIAVFAYLGYQDWKTQKVPHVAVSILWMLLAWDTVLFGRNLDPLSVAAGVFACFYALFSFGSIFLKQENYGWGDVLMIPVAVAFAVTIAPTYESAAIVAVAGVAPMILAGVRKDRIPVAPFLCLALLVAYSLKAIA